MSRDARISQSWIDNAQAWTECVRAGLIASRRAGTDAAIIAAILEGQPERVLDIGCGEGWLSRRLAREGVAVTGFDGSIPLLERAAAEGGAQFLQLNYDQFVAEPKRAGEHYDVAVFNFSLFAEDVVPVLKAARTLLRETGRLIIQTVHPFNDAPEAGYVDGWREESLSSMSADFKTAMPWYFRTMASWVNSVTQAGLTLLEMREPFNAAGGQPLSLLLIAQRAH